MISATTADNAIAKATGTRRNMSPIMTTMIIAASIVLYSPFTVDRITKKSIPSEQRGRIE